ncbi:MAG: hypothetical protein C0596_17330 [Marinilabiliales bacterium]|nr:MAG: hypothetical protein C0596_17330 [Marinilabiliales bacterium]
MQSCNKKVDSTKALLEEIENKYEGKWFKHVKFLQTTNFYKNDSIYKAERWAEEYVYPGQLIIKVDSDTSNNGYLYRRDSVYIFEKNQLIYKDQVFHDLIILSMDIYNMTAEESYKRFSELDYDLDKFDTREYNGRKVYVVGAEKGDTTSNQVWFDAEHLYFVKMIKSNEHGRQEVVFNDYININGSAWIEQEVVFYLDGKKYMEEKYYNIQIPDVERDKLEINDFKGFNISLINPIEIIIEDQIDKYIYSLYYMTLGGY